MTDDIEVRRLTPSDAAELAGAFAALVGAAEPEPGTEVRTVAPLSHLAALLATPNCYVFLACGEGAPVGYVTAYRFPRLHHPSDQVYVFDIEVAPAARRRGVGRRLLTTLLATCWAEGVTWAWAGTARENVAARTLFEVVGGKQTGETYIEFEFAPAE